MFILVTSKVRCQVGIRAIKIADYFSQIHPRRFKVVAEAQRLNKKWLDMDKLLISRHDFGKQETSQR